MKPQPNDEATARISRCEDACIRGSLHSETVFDYFPERSPSRIEGLIVNVDEIHFLPADTVSVPLACSKAEGIAYCLPATDTIHCLSRGLGM